MVGGEDGIPERTRVDRAVFGTLADGTPVEAVTLRNRHGTSARLIAFGATLQALHVADRDGQVADIVLGYADLETYVAHPQFFGATIGRYGNRIDHGQFGLAGQEFRIARRVGPHALHGGARGFDQRLWTIESVSKPGEPASVAFHYLSHDGEEGFPGTLDVRAGYSLADDNTLTLWYQATTDAPTVVNLTNHSFFNLGGEAGGRTALDHLLTIHADHITPVTPGMIPTGAMLSLDDSPLDFRTPTRIADRIRNGRDPQLAYGRGYDHNYALRGGLTLEPRPAVRLADPVSGRVLDIATTEPGLQFYSGNFLDGTSIGKSGLLYRQGDGLCFETQHFPDSPNQPSFPSTRLDPGQTWRSRTVWRFTTDQT